MIKILHKRSYNKSLKTVAAAVIGGMRLEKGVEIMCHVYGKDLVKVATRDMKRAIKRAIKEAV